MRAASIASSLLFVALLLTATTAEEPNAPTSPSVAPQPTAEELTEIEKIRAAMGPEFRIASKMFGADLSPPTPTATVPAAESLQLDASSPAGSLYLQASPPTVERAIQFLKLAEHDLSSHTQGLGVPAMSRQSGYSAAEKQQLKEAVEKCRELAKQLESLTVQSRMANPQPAANAVTPSN